MAVPPAIEKLRASLAQSRWDQATATLHQFDLDTAAALLMRIPFEEQQALFRNLPVSYAAALVPAFPYYHAYLLLQSRPNDEMKSIIDAMHPGERMQFFDELPQETWQQLMDELASKEPEPSELETPEPIAPARAPEPPIIDARRIEKGFERPGGGEMQVIAPTDLTVEPGLITALLGPYTDPGNTL